MAAPSGSDAPGCSTTGSSEACMLGGVALLYHGVVSWRWVLFISVPVGILVVLVAPCSSPRPPASPAIST